MHLELIRRRRSPGGLGTRLIAFLQQSGISDAADLVVCWQRASALRGPVQGPHFTSRRAAAVLGVVLRWHRAAQAAGGTRIMPLVPLPLLLRLHNCSTSYSVSPRWHVG